MRDMTPMELPGCSQKTEFGMEVGHSVWLKVETGYDDTLKVRVAEFPSLDIR